MIDCLNQTEFKRLEELRVADPSVNEVLRQLERILESKAFERAQRNAREFLAFAVAKTLLGDGNQIKQTVIAVRVFGESAEYDPLNNSMVRVAAFSLRKRLGAYYAGEGKRDPIEISMRAGSYIPAFEQRSSPSVLLLPREPLAQPALRPSATGDTLLDLTVKVREAGTRRVIWTDRFEVHLGLTFRRMPGGRHDGAHVRRGRQVERLP